jgi:hypothetical protein
MSAETGPYLKAALICETVIDGKDGVLSLIRVVDRLILAAAGPGAPADMPPNEYPLTLVLMLVSGRARGTGELTLLVEPPDGQPKQFWTNTVFFEGEERGANVVVQFNYKFEKQGLYWFHVRLDDEQLTRVPYRVIYQRAVPGTLPQ